MDKIIPVWKDRGISSYDVIRKIKKNILNVKIGHCGTLDPFAEGILLICIGSATKQVENLMSYEKIYEAKIFIGKETDTLDITGNVIKEHRIPPINKNKIENALKHFDGKIFQSPPYYSAVKFHGVRLYKFARNDIHIRKKPREVVVNNIKILNFDDDSVSLRISVGKGFYIRSFAKDLAAKLDSFGHLQELKRVSIGPYNKSSIVKIKDIVKCQN